MTSPQNPLSHAETLDRLHSLRGVLFDLDGVLTPTADVHMHAWSRLFTPYLEEQGVSPAYSDADYFEYIDGKPRYDGVRSLLASRGITLPDGLPTDAPDQETVCGLGNRKNEAFNETLAEEGVTPYPGSIDFLDFVTRAGLLVAVVTSSRNGELTLAAAGIRDRFEVVVDGLLSASRGLAGKPAPDTYELGAELLGLTPAECVVVEDAQSGIQAGRAGNFGLVLGVDRGVGRQTLLGAGADIVVSDLDELVPASVTITPNNTSATTEANA
ncbi:beta-phosphoglucomutase family hydrolase [Cryobacterium sp. MP_M5]|uniref:HAD family hydrolase n=1 Tax=unclassified Cryobacterium TaxID=2649013 RepID=UPI0018C955EA|nr:MULTISPECIES: HAD-IA family hydrolase [unclassified Cryobacterium]MBG6059044.1 beta-phosphoglucomutase family hydrolase [Cryobacterium sp. MP_M3]MEC5177338.1 beta-phosphoglucomutase family hydrolase [Cryobacterium sp. MP_M5]